MAVTMPPLELAPKPPGLERSTSNDELQFEDTTRQGHTVTIVRDRDGDVVFPSYVPQEIQSPTAAGDLASPANLSSTQLTKKAEPMGNEHLVKSKSDPSAIESGKETKAASKRPGGSRRPSMNHIKRWATEGPNRTRRRTSTMPSAPKRAGTSYLDRGMWNHHPDDSSTSSSSSEDEGDVEETPEQREEKRRQKREEEQGRYGRFRVGNDNYRTSGKIKKDGRLRITVKETANTGYLAKALGAAAKKVVPMHEPGQQGESSERPTGSRFSSATTATSVQLPRPRLNIVIMVIGSRGDAQPFLKIGKVLKEKYGHRVRIATHPAFRDFVEQDSGLEFFSVGGDPSELMAFMVKNPGMIPSLETVRAGDIGRRRQAMAEMFDGFWRACINATDDEKDMRNLKMMGEKDPFVADAIIANPPSFAHVHCAEALGIPLHLMFTFPYTPTQAFPHPLASIKKSNVDPGYTNFISYPLVEMMVWQGLGDLVNDFRSKTLGLDPVSTLWAPGATYRLHVPFTYLWSPGLVPKPEDWGDEIDVSGFVFLDLASTFKPPRELEAFLKHKDKPIYIGFGSIVVDDADRFTRMVFEAVKLAGVRALVSKGWGGLGCDDVPDNIYMLENTPHDWLFPKVQACVIHGGAGTTAIALKCGLPTMIVPFFGDQHFWGSMLGNAGAGPMPVPYKSLTAEKLAEGIKYCLTDEAKAEAAKISKDIELEGDGAENAVQSFHHHLTLRGRQSMRCSILSDRVASWKVKNTSLKLSPIAAEVLVERGLLSWRKLRLIRHVEWNDFEGPGEPVTGAMGSIFGTVGTAFGGVGSLPVRITKLAQKRRDHKQRKKAAREQAKLALLRPRSATKTKPAMGSRKSTTATQAGSSGQQATTPGADPSSAKHTEHPPSGDLDNISINTTTTADGADAYVNEVTSGVGQTASALVRAPIDLSLAVAQGFHNAPRLYGDETVRRPIRVTGMRSGLRAAGSEFAFGIYDGWTGVVRLPVREAKKHGAKGLIKGTGMGITGFFLKNLAALAGPVGYTLKGVAKQIDRSKQPIRFVRKARIFQGERELRALERRGESRGSGSGSGNGNGTSNGNRNGSQPNPDAGSDRGRNDNAGIEFEEQVTHGWEVMRQLWEALEEKEKRKGLRGRLSARKKRGEGAVFESVEIAERALEAMRKGEPISTVVGTEKELRKSEEHHRRRSVEGRRSVDKKTSADKTKEANVAKQREADIAEEEDAHEDGKKGVAAEKDGKGTGNHVGEKTIVKGKEMTNGKSTARPKDLSRNRATTTA